MYFLIKRGFDILFSSIVILVLLPLFVPIMIILKFTGEGEIFYFQKRIGLNNKVFKVFKFATKEVPNAVESILDYSNNSTKDLDAIIFHQANI